MLQYDDVRSFVSEELPLFFLPRNGPALGRAAGPWADRYRKDQPRSSSPLAAIQLPETRQAMRNRLDCQAAAHAATRVVMTKTAPAIPMSPRIPGPACTIG